MHNSVGWRSHTGVYLPEAQAPLKLSKYGHQQTAGADTGFEGIPGSPRELYLPGRGASWAGLRDHLAMSLPFHLRKMSQRARAPRLVAPSPPQGNTELALSSWRVPLLKTGEGGHSLQGQCPQGPEVAMFILTVLSPAPLQCL